MKIDIVEWSSFTPQRRAGNYDMARNGWVMDYNDASNMLELFVSTNGNNDGKYNSSALTLTLLTLRLQTPQLTLRLSTRLKRP